MTFYRKEDIEGIGENVAEGLLLLWGWVQKQYAHYTHTEQNSQQQEPTVQNDSNDTKKSAKQKPKGG